MIGFNSTEKVMVTDNYDIWLKYNLMKHNHWDMVLLSHKPIHPVPMSSNIGFRLMAYTTLSQEIHAVSQQEAEQKALEIAEEHIAQYSMVPLFN
jgi:hypothetical protein